MAKRDFRKGSLPFEFIPLPKAVLLMREFTELPSSAKALLLDLAAQYSGKNNGKLCPSWEVMKRSGWVSKGTLQRARDALLKAPFVVLTRKGHPPRTVDWIAFTWWKLDFDPRAMDAWIDPRRFPYLNFVRLELPAEKRIVSPRNGGLRTENLIPRPPELRGQDVLQ